MAKKLWEKSDFERLKDKELTVPQRKMRHELRYACFRVQKELLEGNKCPKEYWDKVKPIQKLDGFEGWEKFAKTWDIAHPDPPTIVKRMWSIEQEHNQMMERISIPLPMKN